MPGSKSLRYGRANYRGKNTLAHRVAWALHHKQDPGSRQVRHTCDNPPCCNPAHLRVGAAKQNTDDMMKRKRDYWGNRTHCKHGHEYTVENTRIVNRASGKSYRQCVTCKRQGS